jgi:hypothetical protein
MTCGGEVSTNSERQLDVDKQPVLQVDRNVSDIVRKLLDTRNVELWHGLTALEDVEPFWTGWASY